MEADYAALRLRPGATPIEVRRAYIELSRRHHPDKGGDATLFRRVTAAYTAITRGGGVSSGAGGGGGAPVPRVTREDAPAAWGAGAAREPAAAAGPLAIEADPQLEAAFRYAGETRKHLAVLDAHRGWAFDAQGTACDPSCLPHVAPAAGGGVACSRHQRVHRCAAGVCCAEERACPMTILCLAQQWRARTPGVLPAEALAAHRCTHAGCTWRELTSLRHPARGVALRRIYVCAASGRPHICTATQCRAGREQQVLDEKGGVARQWRCQISGAPLGPLMPWQDGTTLALGTAPVARLEAGPAAGAARGGNGGRGDGRGGGRGGGRGSGNGRGGGGGSGSGRAAPPRQIQAPQPFKRPRLDDSRRRF